MDYFNDVITFLSLESGSFLLRVRKISDFIKNTLMCVPKMKEGLTGLERHEGE